MNKSQSLFTKYELPLFIVLTQRAVTDEKKQVEARTFSQHLESHVISPAQETLRNQEKEKTMIKNITQIGLNDIAPAMDIVVIVMSQP